MSEESSDLLDRIGDEVSELPGRVDVTPDEAFLLRTKLEAAQRRIKDTLKQLDAFLVDWMPGNCREFTIADTVYYVASNKKVKPKSLTSAVDAIFRASEGDWERFTDCLSANALKVGECRKVLGDQFDSFFETTVEMDLEHKPVKSLHSVNKKFLR